MKYTYETEAEPLKAMSNLDVRDFKISELLLLLLSPTTYRNISFLLPKLNFSFPFQKCYLTNKQVSSLSNLHTHTHRETQIHYNYSLSSSTSIYILVQY